MDQRNKKPRKREEFDWKRYLETKREDDLEEYNEKKMRKQIQNYRSLR